MLCSFSSMYYGIVSNSYSNWRSEITKSKLGKYRVKGEKNLVFHI